jgi:uncharacterized protein YlxW (UPF0749 family)
MTMPVTDHPGPTDEGVLESFLAQVVVDDYAGVAPRHDEPPQWTRHWSSLAVLILIGVVVASAVISTRTSDEARQQTRNALSERVAALSATIDERQAAVDEQSTAVDGLRAEVLAAGAATGPDVETAALASQAGTTALSGPGLTVTIDDALDAEAGSLNRVLDRDIQDIVNVLWSMGAAGVAVNEQRLTGVTAIRGAGEAILVNYQPLTRPYTVTAVGTTTSGEEDSALQSLLSGLSTDYGLVSQVGSGDVALPAGELRAPRFARVDLGGGEQ